MRSKAEVLDEQAFLLTDVVPRSPTVDEIRVRTRFISLDPYLARSMRAWEGEHPGWLRGEIRGRIVGEVIESRDPAFATGDVVLTLGRWQAENVVPTATSRPIPAVARGSPSLALGVLGASGATAWVGLRLAAPKRGETILVSAATGPVGSVVGQLARRAGLRTIGIAGGSDKCRHAETHLGFDLCLDHREVDLDRRIADAAPSGVNILFENVGQRSLDATLPSLAMDARVMLCGLAQHYNDNQPMQLAHFKALLYKSVTLRGFRTASYPEWHAAALADLEQGIAERWLHHDTTIFDGLEQAPRAYLEMLRGVGIGKRLIRLT